MYVHPQHPPDKEYRDDGPGDVNDPVANCFWFSEIEHWVMVAGFTQLKYIPLLAFAVRDGADSVGESTKVGRLRTSF